MEYTAGKLAQLAGISSRTLRYYDQIGILKPARTSASGYRIYGPDEVDMLQQILFYRELGVSLEKIGEILRSPAFDAVQALREHRDKLLQKRKQLDLLIENVAKTIARIEGRRVMTDREKFEGFKSRLIEENERRYSREIREKYGDDAVDRSNAKIKNMTEEQYAEATRLAEEVKAALSAAFRTGDPAGEQAQQAADLHRRWLSCYWDSYTREAHAGLVQMYVDDPRFTAYYDEEQPGTAAFLRDAVFIYTGRKEGK